MDNKIEEIKERLSKSTPGPWTPMSKSKGMTGVNATDCRIYHATLDPVCLPETHARQIRDAEFIAHSRSDISYLLSKVEAAEKLAQAAKDIDLCFVMTLPAATANRDSILTRKLEYIIQAVEKFRKALAAYRKTDL
jgi:hypothetical protein